MTNCFQQSYTINTPVTSVLSGPIDNPVRDVMGIFSTTLICSPAKAAADRGIYAAAAADRGVYAAAAADRDIRRSNSNTHREMKKNPIIF